ncbi:MAG: flippase-like domain-containing protein, partial [Gammaproteobacteria bacterium]|nr:flippase-like domain-containing protein [Gammaproteobacteria bacterium]
MSTKLTRNISRVLLLSVAIYFVGVWYVGWEEIVTALGKVEPLVILVPLGFSLLAYLVRFGRWQYYLGLFNKPVDTAYSALVYFSGFALAMTPGKVGELLRCAYLKKYRISYKRSSAMFVVERLLDVIAMLILSTLAIRYFSDKLGFLYIIITIALIALAMLVSPRVL